MNANQDVCTQLTSIGAKHWNTNQKWCSALNSCVWHTHSTNDKNTDADTYRKQEKNMQKQTNKRSQKNTINEKTVPTSKMLHEKRWIDK